MKRRVFDWAGQPMAITESAFRSLVAKVASMPDPLAGGESPSANWEDFVGPAAVRDESLGSVRIIHVSGVIDRFVPKFWREVGFVDVEFLSERIRAAVGDETVESIVLEMNTPGGCVWGTPEAANVIADASMAKPLVVHASNLLASAGYWLAAGASAILADPSSEIGSIGVYTPLWDFRGFYEEFGMKVELAKTGELKGAGYPGTEWTEEQKAHEQEVVNDYFVAFKAHIKAHRDIADDCMTGGCYVAARALANGFLDSLGSLADAVALATDLGRSVKQNEQ